MTYPFPKCIGAPDGRRHSKFSFWSLVATSALAMMATSASIALGEEPLQIESIVCEGNEKATCDFIQSKTALKAGDPVDDEKVKDAALRLNLIGYFKDTEMRLSKGSRPGLAVLTIKVIELSNYALTVSAGAIKPAQRPLESVIDATGTNKNISGSGDTLSVRIRAKTRADEYDGSQNTRVIMRAEYFRPSFLAPRMYLLSGITAGKYFSEYDCCHDTSVDVGLGYRLFDYGFAALGLRYQTDFSYLDRYSVFGRFGWDSQDSATFPTQGSRLLVGLERYWSRYRNYSGRNDGFSITSLAFLKHWGLGEGHVLSFRLGGFDQHDPSLTVEEDQAISLRYSRILKRHSEGEPLKTALYVEPGAFFVRGGWNYGAKVGANIQTKFGLVNLFLLGGGK